MKLASQFWKAVSFSKASLRGTEATRIQRLIRTERDKNLRSPEPTSVRVLLVEDNSADAEILTEVLTYDTDVRFEVEWVERVSAGAERITRIPHIDIALVDLKLPDADGLEALELIRGAAPRTPIFVMTGFEDDALAFEAKRRGADGFLVKGRLAGREIRSRIVDAVRDSLPILAPVPAAR